MREAAILRIVATVAGVVVIIVAGCLGASALKNQKWWAVVLGCLVSIAMVYVGYKTIRAGNFGAYYGN